jgi:hypothetical protein
MCCTCKCKQQQQQQQQQAKLLSALLCMIIIQSLSAVRMVINFVRLCHGQKQYV